MADGAVGAGGDGVADLDAEDQKLVTLARSARARTQAAEGAALRDGMGRTYAAATVALPSLALTALQAAAAAAVTSGADGFEAAVVHSSSAGLVEADTVLLADLAPPVVLLVSGAGAVRRLR